MTRRRFVRNGAVLGALVAAVGVSGAVTGAGRSRRGVGPYGPLLAPDRNGIQLPAGFSSRTIARTGDSVFGSSYRWHDDPDGGACFPAPDGGFVYVSNSEVGSAGGGVGAVRFAGDGRVVDAYSILSGTDWNCAGGATPWGTWLSCEESGRNGKVWECDPLGRREAIERVGLGSFNHEAAVVVEFDRTILLTEDASEGRLYRFTPNTWTDLSSGRFEAARVGSDGGVTWVDVAIDRPDRSDTTTPFDGGEGLTVDGTDVFMATKGDRRLWHLDVAADTIRVLHDCLEHPDTSLTHVDNLLVEPLSGDLYVAEDGGNQELCVLTGRTDDDVEVAPFVRLVGHRGSEIAGQAFSPDGRTMLFSSQRGTDGRGLTYAVTGPFRGAGPATLDDSLPLGGLEPAHRTRNR